MNDRARHVQKVYLTLLLLHTLAASFIWGINTLFLLDAGLSNTQAFAANAFFTLGLVVFEVPTGVTADIRGRRFSYLLGTLTLIASTVLYLLMWRISAGFWAWALSSALLGLGFTFFSGAVEAWLVDALTASGFKGPLDSVLARGEIVEGAAMLTGSVAGGYLAQVTNLGIPYVARAVVLVLTFVLAFALMHDVGFTPKRGDRLIREVKTVLTASLKYGLGNPPIRWIMLASAFMDGVSIYAFYAMQPYLLELFGDPTAYGIAGLAAAMVAGAQIVGGAFVPRIRHLFRRRTDFLLLGAVLSSTLLILIGLTSVFIVALVLLGVWCISLALATPMRQAFINGIIPSEQRATVLSFDSLMGSAGGVVAQPILGRAADVYGYAQSYVIAGAITALVIPFTFLARRERAPSDAIEREPEVVAAA
jgi:MFS family permease